MLGYSSNIVWIDQNDLAKVEAALRQEDIRILRINGETIRDRSDVLTQVGSQLPEDPAYGTHVSLDALQDSLAGGISTLEERKVAIVWTHVHQMLNHGAADLAAAIQMFQVIIDEFSDPKFGPLTKNIGLFLMGAGKDFPRFSDQASVG